MESELGSRLPQKDEKKTARRWRYIRAEARLPEGIEERVMMEAREKQCLQLLKSRKI